MNVENLDALRKIGLKLEHLRTIDAQMPVHYALAFVYIAQNEGCSVSGLHKALYATLPSASRIADALSDGGNISLYILSILIE